MLEPVIDLNSPFIEDGEYLSIKEIVVQNKAKYPDVKIVDKYIYYRTQHNTGE